MMLCQSDKANWSDVNTLMFCYLVVDQKRDGHTSNGALTRRGYENIAPEYEARVGLRHDVRQLRNRWNQLKGMYAWYLWAIKQTGIGRQENVGLDAPNSWWQRHTKVMTVICYIVIWETYFC